MLGEDTGISKGDFIHHVRNTELAAALASIGVPLRKDPPYCQVELANGQRITTFNFEPYTKDRTLRTADLIKAWKQDLAFIQKYPQHPFTFAMAAVKNLDRFREHLKEDKPWVVYRPPAGQSRYLVKPGSKKETALIREGFKRL